MLAPHLETQSLPGFAASCCGNCCSGRAGALLLGGKGAAGAEEYLNHPSFMQRSLQNYRHKGKMKLRATQTKWNGLKNVSTPDLSLVMAVSN